MPANAPTKAKQKTKAPQADTRPVIWRPHPGTSQELFLSCPIPEVLYQGTRGPGKSDSLLMKFAKHVGAGYGTYWRGIIFRREYKDLDDLVVKSKRWFRQIWPEAQWVSSKADYKWVWPTGEELLFRAVKVEEDYWSYHGHEYPFVGWDELCTWPTPHLYDALKTTNRCSKVGVPLTYASTANPYGPGHRWVKERWITAAPPGRVIEDEEGNQRVHIFGSIAENPSLDEKYLNTLMSDPDPHRRKAWLYGSWDIVIGGRFEGAWNPDKHVLDPFVVPASWRVDRAFDWGSAKPYSVGWYAESDGKPFCPDTGEPPKEGQRSMVFPKHSVIRIGELYGWTGVADEGARHTNAEIARRALEAEEGLRRAGILKHHQRVQPGPADAAIYAVMGGDSIGTELERHGLSFVPANKGAGSRRSGWQKLYGMLVAANSDLAEMPGFWVFSTCKQWIRTVPSLARDKRDPDDVDTDQEDHCADETRYRINSERSTGLGPMALKWAS